MGNQAGTSAPGERAALIAVWDRQRAWSIGANDAKKQVEQGRKANLVLLVVAAILGALGSQHTWFCDAVLRAWSIFAAILLAGAGALQARYLTSTKIKAWTAARSASETLKAACYTYQAGVAPYDGENRDSLLIDQLDAVEERALTFAARSGSSDHKVPPSFPDIDGYRAERTKGQRDWHETKSHQHEKTAGRLRIAQFALTAIGAGLALLGSVVLEPRADAWVSAVAAMGAAVAAHVGATRYDHIAQTYQSTVAQLDRAMLRFDLSSKDPASEALLVQRTEDILARQNDSWLDLIDHQETAAD